MKSEQEVRKKLNSVRGYKNQAKRRDNEQSYISSCRVERALMWVLDQKEKPKSKIDWKNLEEVKKYEREYYQKKKEERNKINSGGLKSNIFLPLK